MTVSMAVCTASESVQRERQDAPVSVRGRPLLSNNFDDEMKAAKKAGAPRATKVASTNHILKPAPGR